MAALPQVRDLHVMIHDKLATRSLAAYSRVLSMVEEVVDMANSSPEPQSPAAATLVYNCAIYQILCSSIIRRLVKKASTAEHRAYNRRRHAGRLRRRREDVRVLDQKQHAAAALEALKLEEFFKQEQTCPRRVRWADHCGGSLELPVLSGRGGACN
ncbi:hypothetical protein F4861DRAFT_272879 [Xylaria intraflava]|nr:hypothetical protein F4861DRAFT_272879 [Xylaria intraflava]